MENEEKLDQSFVEEKPRKRRSVFGIIVNIILWLLVIFVLANGILGVVNLQKVQNNEQPLVVLNEKEYNEEGTTVKVYNFGLYKIVKETDANKETIALKLWFLDDRTKKAY